MGEENRIEENGIHGKTERKDNTNIHKSKPLTLNPSIWINNKKTQNILPIDFDSIKFDAIFAGKSKTTIT